MATDVLLDPEGRAVAAGHASAGAVYEFALARFDGAGALDRGFGGGVVLTSFPGVTVARATALARQADGKLVVAGIACASGHGMQCDGGTARLALARYEVAPGAPRGRPVGGALPSGPTTGRAALRLAAVEADRAPRQGARARPLRAGEALPRHAHPAPAAEAASARCCWARSGRRVPARRTRTIVVTVRRSRLGATRKLRVRMQFAGRDAAGQRGEKIAKRVPLRRR